MNSTDKGKPSSRPAGDELAGTSKVGDEIHLPLPEDDEPKSAASVPEAKTPSIVVPFILALVGIGAMIWMYDFGSEFANRLGNDASDARLALLLAFAAGGFNIVRMLRKASHWNTSMGQTALSIYQLAVDGAGAAEALNRAELQAETDRGTFRSRIAEYANIQVLIGMLLTAVWLASQVHVFQSATLALEAGAGGGMGPIVAALLQLGPKAFIATAAAVSSALVLLVVGHICHAWIDGRGLRRTDYLSVWRRGHEIYQQKEYALLEHRTTNLVARTVSVAQVRETQETFLKAMKDMARLLEEANRSLAGFRQTSDLITQSSQKLQEVTDSLGEAQLHVEDVVGGLEGLSAKVEGFGRDLLGGTQAFTEQLIQDTKDRIPLIFDKMTTSTLDFLKPGFEQLAQDLHTNMEASARQLQIQHANAYELALQDSVESMKAAMSMSETLAGNARELGGVLNRSADEWSTASAKFEDSTRKVSSAFAEATGQGNHAAIATAEAREALVRAAEDAAQAAQALRRLVAEANREIHNVRRDAETLGRVKEVLGDQGLGRARL